MFLNNAKKIEVILPYKMTLFNGVYLCETYRKPTIETNSYGSDDEALLPTRFLQLDHSVKSLVNVLLSLNLKVQRGTRHIHT